MMKTSLSLRIAFVLLLSGLLPARPAAGQPNTTTRSYLTGRYSPDSVRALLTPRDAWRPYPRAGEPGWDAVPAAVRDAHIREAETLIGTTWEPLPASVFLEYVRTGNRSNYQNLSFARREKLAKLVLAEAMEAKGRFLDDILNGIWAISEETYWGVPAHLYMQEAGPGLPDVDEPTVDLFAAETASLMAWTDYLLGDRLDAVSPLVRERIRAEVDRRILTPNLTREDFWWMGFSGGRINNWNPWINSNWLTAVLLLETDEDRRAKAVYKIMRSLDRFIDSYPDDGGCDEGPGYWSRAAGSMYDTLELLDLATGGAIDIFDRPLIREMGRYIYRSYIASPFYINFADAGPRVAVEPALVYRYGRSTGDSLMTGFASFVARETGFGKGYVPGRFGHLNRQLPALFVIEALHGTPPLEPLPAGVWLPDTQVMVARSQEGSREGFYLAAKGGHNDESHNHNDVGNFIVYHNGLPVLIDVGAGEYTAKTFSRDRYTIWNMQSAYHNVPTINGVMQQQGRDYRARRVEFKTHPTRARLQLDLSRAYPEEARVLSWIRVLTLNRGGDIVLEDDYLLEDYVAPSVLHFMTPRAVEVVEPGTIAFRAPTGDAPLPARDVFMHYDPQQLDVTLEHIPLDDARLKAGWGEALTRVSLTTLSTDTRGDLQIRLTY